MQNGVNRLCKDLGLLVQIEQTWADAHGPAGRGVQRSVPQSRAMVARPHTKAALVQLLSHAVGSDAFGVEQQDRPLMHGRIDVNLRHFGKTVKSITEYLETEQSEETGRLEHLLNV